MNIGNSTKNNLCMAIYKSDNNSIWDGVWNGVWNGVVGKISIMIHEYIDDNLFNFVYSEIVRDVHFQGNDSCKNKIKYYGNRETIRR